MSIQYSGSTIRASPFRRGFYHLYDAWLARGKSSYTDFRSWLDTHVEKNEWLVVDAKEQQEIQSVDGTVLGTMNALQAILLDENGHPWPVIPTKEDVDKIIGGLQFQAITKRTHLQRSLLDNWTLANKLCQSELFNRDQTLAAYLLNFYTVFDKGIQFLEWAINSESSGKGSLFNERSFTTKLMRSFFFCEEGIKYLRRTVQPIIAEVCETRHSLEIDPAKLAAIGDEEADLKANLKTMIRHINRLLDALTKSVSLCPIRFRRLMSSLYHMFAPDVARRFFFIRFFCASLTMPEKYGLTNTAPGKDARGGLINISKFLLNLATKTEYESKERYAVELNKLIRARYKEICQFTDGLANEAEIDAAESRGKPARLVRVHEKLDAMTKLQIYLESNADKIPELYPTVIKNFDVLGSNIPPIKTTITQDGTTYEIRTLPGLNKSSAPEAVANYASIVYGNTTSKANERIFANVELSGDSRLFAVSEGFSEGQAGQDAASLCATAALSYLSQHKSKITNSTDAGHYLLHSVLAANDAILRTKDTLTDAGTASFVAGAITPRVQAQTVGFVGTFVVVGDLKVYLISSEHGVLDVTVDSLATAESGMDVCGGLGPMRQSDLPDLRNLKLFSVSLNTDDVLLVLPSAVYRNFDPQFAGQFVTSQLANVNANLSPTAHGGGSTIGFQNGLPIQFKNFSDWQSVWASVVPREIEQVKEQLRTLCIQSVLGDFVSLPDPSIISHRLIDAVVKISERRREKYKEENHPEKSDFAQYPGWLGDSTILGLRVGLLPGQIDKPSAVNAVGRSRTPSLEGGDQSLESLFTIGQEIGRGGFSIVYEATNKKTGEMFACKSIKTKFIKKRLLDREIEIMKECDHENILKLYNVFEEKKYLHLILELVKGGELFDRIVDQGELNEPDCVTVLLQIISAVKYLHDKGIAHRDLKPQNILCVDDSSLAIRVADFGLSKMYNGGSDLQTCCGSPEYVAPEVLEGQIYTSQVDMWSLGVVTYILLTGCFPFYHKNTAILYEKIRRVEYIWPNNSPVSPAARHFVRCLLEKDPNKRLKAVDSLDHPWIRERGKVKEWPPKQ